MKVLYNIRIFILVSFYFCSNILDAQTPTQYNYLNFEKASIGSDKFLTENNKTYFFIQKGDFKIPEFSTQEHYKGIKSLVFEMDPTDPDTVSKVDGNKNDKSQYNFTTDKSGGAIPPITFGVDAYVGFAFKLDKTMDVPLKATQLFQIWQGAPMSPPFAIRLLGVKENTKIQLSVEYRNNKTTGRNEKAIVIYDTIINKEEWYSIVLMVNMRTVADKIKKDGVIKMWLNKNKVIDANVRFGYSDGVVAKDIDGDGILDGTKPNKFPRVEIGPYRNRNLARFKAYYDEIKYANTFDLADPDANPVAKISSPLSNQTVNSDSTVLVKVSNDNSTSKVDFFDNGILVASDSTSPFTYSWKPSKTGTHVISIKPFDKGNNEGISDKVTINVINKPSSNTNFCNFGTPSANSLSAINKEFNVVQKFGTGGPDVTNFKLFKIQWNPSNNSIYNFEVRTYNGKPNWFVDLKNQIISQNLNSSNPSITLKTDTILKLTGSYDVTIHNGNFVMAERSGKFTLYFSNSTIVPSCVVLREGLSEQKLSSTTLYPNPAINFSEIRSDINLNASTIFVENQMGIEFKVPYTISENIITLNTSFLEAGIYNVLIRHENSLTVKKMMIVK